MKAFSPVRLFATIAAVLLFASAATQVQAAENYKVDNGHSSILFRVKHFNVSNFYGRFLKSSGSIATDNKQDLTAVAITVQADSIFTANQKRDAHLKANDYFNVAQYPTISFKSTKVEALGNGKFKVTGTLNFMGKDKTIDFTAHKTGAGKDPWGGFRVGYEASFTFDRTEFMAETKGVGKMVTMIISLEGIKQ